MSIADAFFDVIEAVSGHCRNGEQLHAYFMGEESDFIRFNCNRIRQAGQVRQYEMQLALVAGGRQCIGYCDITGQADRDRGIAAALLEQLRQRLPACPEDPFVNYNTEPCNSISDTQAVLPEPETVTETVMMHADGLDLVGHYAAGEIMRAFCNSFGQRNQHRRRLFNLDWSCHDRGDKAVKAGYAGDRWLEQEFTRRLDTQRELLAVMQKPAKRLSPGRYRSYLAPTALAEIMFLLTWEGFSLRKLRTRQSPLLQLADQQQQLSDRVTILEQRQHGFCPAFSDAGFNLPVSLELVRNGKAVNYLVDARSSREYEQPVNASTEQPLALDMAPGQLPTKDVLQALDTGLYICNLWYGNYSDRNACRLTGMTRYACMWVENGEIQAPIEVMRFDDSVYRMLGDNLVDLTRERELIHDPHTYDRRSLISMNLPGALIEDFTLTL